MDAMPVRYGSQLTKSLSAVPGQSKYASDMCSLSYLKGLGTAMTRYTHQTAPTRFAEANGIRFAYRRFGKAGGVPLVFNQHFTGTMDHWDPAVTDGLAKDREVILFNNAGVSSSSGEVPTNVRGNGCQRHRLHQGAGTEAGGCARLFDRWLRRPGDHATGPRSGPAPGAGRHRPARRPEHGHPHAGSTADLRRHLQSAGGALAEGPLHRLGSQPGRRPRIPETFPPPHRKPRSRGERG